MLSGLDACRWRGSSRTRRNFQLPYVAISARGISIIRPRFKADRSTLRRLAYVMRNDFYCKNKMSSANRRKDEVIYDDRSLAIRPKFWHDLRGWVLNPSEIHTTGKKHRASYKLRINRIHVQGIVRCSVSAICNLSPLKSCGQR